MLIALWTRLGSPKGMTARRTGAGQQGLWQSLAPFALQGGYANLLGPDELEQASGAYGGNAAWLLAAKRRFDPDRPSRRQSPVYV
jgi:hypothetical protein